MNGAAIHATLAALRVGPLQFDRPWWLVGLPILLALTYLMSRRSLAGLGGATRWVALAIRAFVLALLVGALAEPRLRKEAKDVAVTAILDVSQSVPVDLQKQAQRFIEDAKKGIERRQDRLGIVTAARDGIVQAIPSSLTQTIEQQHAGALDATNLATALRLALAIKPDDAAYRIVVASDGNETGGNLLEEVERARALGVPIDVIPLRYAYPSEVLVDRVVVPANAREGEPIALRVVLNSTRAARGRLAILVNDEPLKIGRDGVSEPMDLVPGVNVKTVQIPATARGPQRYEAVFIPDVAGGEAQGDTVAENNKGSGITFVAGEGRVLVLTESTDAADHFVRALTASNIKVEVRPGGDAPKSLIEWNGYDLVVLFNQSSDLFTQRQQEDLRQYVHDGGGGLLVVGGPESFGAGGWIGSPLEEALPVRLDPPQKRQMPKGALVMVIHSVELPQGVYWGKRVCEAAAGALSRLDLVGINEYDWKGGGTRWTHELQPVGDGTKVKRAINSLTFGDMPDFRPSFELTYDSLASSDAGQKHVILISDGDPQAPPTALLDKYVKAGITVSAVGMSVHGANESANMKWIADYTKGRYYEVKTQAQLAKLPQIFVKEAQTIRRTLIWEGKPFTPTFTGIPSESLRGVTGVPPITGYVVTAEREGLALTTIKGREGDPILAQWQHGLGKVVAFTSDASSRWNASWIAWDGYRAFWEQHTRWAMRPSGSRNVRVMTETKGDTTIVTVDAMDAAGGRLDFARFHGRVATPDGKGIDLTLKQVGPGRYQGAIVAPNAGASVVSLRYVAPDATTSSGVIEGSVQAAINRPFADEFRLLQDNAALLEQVAGVTGGAVIDPSKKPDLWRRAGLTMPVATRALWLAFALAGIALFLIDVGVRRVRIDLPMIWNAIKGLASRGRVKSGEHVSSLKAARAKARTTIARGDLTPEERVAIRATAQADEALAKVKFEAAPEQLRRPAAPIVTEIPTTKATKPGAPPAPAAPQAPGEGLGRLMKAKQKAREGMDDTRQ